MRISKIYFGIFLLGALLTGCKDEEEVLPTPDVTEEPEPSPNIAINNWIQSVMNEVYYWLDDMKSPIASDSDPAEYFESLLFRPTDRFSAIYPDYQELINSLNGVELEAGYEFILYRESNENDNVIAQLSYVKRNSPASEAGLRRGDIITLINGRQMDINNFRDVLADISQTHTISYLRYNEEANQYQPQPDLQLTPVQLSENPNFLDTVYTINDQKIGYVVYHFFAPGSGNNSTVYDDEMDETFSKFKAEGINHLIVDFRYNGGGFVSSAVNLASLIAPGVGADAVFSKTKFNSFLSRFEDFQNVQTKFRAKDENLGNTLSGNRVYILTTSRTASASELVINGLKPYMDVFLIGDRTTGKNVGSIPFEDDDNPNNSFGILPIVTQSFNSADQSDYTTGFVPNIAAREVEELPRQFGDINEQLLRKAIEQITGQSSSARIQSLDRIDLGSTLDHKVRTGTMVEKQDLMKNN